MTHTSTEQPEALRVAAWLITAPQKTTIGDMLIAGRELRRLHARVQELEKAQAQSATLSEVMDLVSEWGMASHANGEAALDAHSPYATPDEIAYADECVQSERAAWKAIEEKLRAHGITQENQP